MTKPTRDLQFESKLLSALFQGLRNSEIRGMLDAATVTEYPARCWLYRQGEPARRFFLIESGLVRLSQHGPEGGDVLIRVVKPREVFGYVSLAIGGSNVVSARVLQASRLAVWDREVLLRLLQSIPQASLNLFTLAVRDLVSLSDRTRRLLTQDVEHRVEWALAELVRTIAVSTPAGSVIRDGVGQKELADMAGTTIFTVSRELAKLQREHILEKRRGQIVVLHPEKLSD